MRKAGLKAFILSFSVSLSTILVANSFFAPQQKSDNQLVISNKSIVLFINKQDDLPAKSHPVKKIALNIENETKEEIKQDIKPYFEITPPQPENMVVMADNNNDDFDYNYIPLNIEITPPENTIKLAENNADAPPISNTTKESARIEMPEIVIANNYIKEESVYQETVNVGTKEKSSPLNEIKIVHNEEKVYTENPVAPALLIPLERDTNSISKRKKLQIVHDGQSNQVASANKNAPINTINAERVSDQTQAQQDIPTWKSMEDFRIEKKNSKENPWIAAVGSKHPKNNLILESESNKDSEEISQILIPKKNSLSNNEIKVAADMVDNLIIPIPEDIKNKKNLTPQLTSSEENKHIEQELDQELGVDRDTDEEIVISDAQGKNLHKNNKGGFFDNLTSIFSSKGETPDEETSSDDNNDGGVLDNISRKIGLKRKGMHILPTEIRLSFQPNRAEISGTTLQWIQAFGKKAAEEETVALEIRLDAQSSPALQRKRLDLLSNILTSRGVGGHKLQVVYTAREPNSFVIRTIKIAPKDKGKNIQYKNQKTGTQYLQW